MKALMNDTKRQFVRCAFYDQTAMQKHFEKMAAQGWLIEKISTYFWTFRRIEPTKLHITVTYFPTASEFDPHPSDKQQMMEEFAARDGWKLLTRWGQIQVFCHEAEDPTPIETDPAAQVDNIYRAMKKNLIPSHLMILALVLYQLIFNGYRCFSNIVEFLSTPYLLASLPIWLLMLFAELNELFTCFRWYKKAKPAAENGIFIPVKTNRVISLTLFLTCLVLLFATLQLPTSLRVFSLIWGIAIIGIIAIGRLTKNWLKSAGASKGTNVTASILLVVILTFVLLSIITFRTFRHGPDDGRQQIGTYEKNNWTFEIYDEPMPLYVEDMMDTGDSTWSKERNRHNETFLLARSEYRQDYLQGGPAGLKNLEYTIVEIKQPFLYDTIWQAMLNKRQDEITDEYIFINHYEPVDASIWNATAAYQLHWSDSILDTYLICWEDKIVEIKFYWNPTEEQMRIAADKLKND